MAATPTYITASNRQSFAAYTLTKRFPHIIEQVIRQNTLQPHQVTGFNNLCEEILNGVVQELQLTAAENAFWQEFIDNYTGKSYYDIPFFKAEAYIYRRIIGIMGYPGTYTDPFLESKMQNLEENRDFIVRFATETVSAANCFNTLLAATLWGNSADLSQIHTNNAAVHAVERKSLLIDDGAAVHTFLQAAHPSSKIDYIADNAGLELVTDLFFIDHLLTGNNRSVTLHLKQYPLFVSDATIADVHIHLQYLQKVDSAALKELVARLEAYISTVRLVLKDDLFWNSPLHFTQLPENIRADFGSSFLQVFKGDANYRRLFEDREWPITTPVTKLPGNNVLAIRTLKSEIMLGLTAEKIDSLYQEDKNWLTNGKYGIVMFVSTATAASD